MELLKDFPSELEIGPSMESFQKAMESQKQLFHSQIDELRNIVVSQCKLTGVNPLSQEMAAGALSINIGKRPRDLLNPKAVKYMQAVFSIKDAVSKKESREIGALFGLTVTQVREYFASQRSRVRKMVRLSREKAIRASANKELLDCISADFDPILPMETVPLSSVGPSTEEAPSCSNQDEVFPGLGESEKHFVENIFSSMCKEETFSGQVKLMEWILQIENPSVVSWFMSKGGVMILATWLSQAASEEQTSVLSAALKVLCHLPLHKTLPAHMSAILQGVNRLRFYRIPDISNRARVLLSKWSKMFAKSQALKKPNGSRGSGAPQQEIDLSQRIGELIGDDSWQSSVDNPDGALVTSYAGSNDSRRIETQEAVKLLTASEDSNKKHFLGSSSAYNKERRKVLLVEQPGQKAASKSQPVKAVPASQQRPITADEIQKAKMRAQFMQSNKTNIEGSKKPSLITNDFLSASEAYLRPKLLEAQKKARLLPPKSSKQEDSPSDQKPNFDKMESLLENCRRVRIPWQAPPEVQLDTAWGVGTGENSKEIEAQKNRMRREKETIYRTTQEVPPNPKEPWDIEMDYDDTLTPQIPIDQLPDADGADASLDTQMPDNHNASVASENPASSSSQATAEPDLELLAVLLKNPELVFALTSGKASGLSNEETVKLLDMLKSSGGAALLNGQAAKAEEQKVEVSLPSPTRTRNVEVSLPSPTPPSRFEVSLPSPTPSSNPGTSGWTSQPANNPFSRHNVPGATAVTASDRSQNTFTVQSQYTSATVVPTSAHHLSSQTPTFAPRSSPFILDSQPLSYTPASAQTPPTNYHPMNNAIMPERLPSNIPLYSRSQMHSQQPYVSEYQAREDSSMGMAKARHQGLAHNSFSSTHASQNVYNPIMRGAGLAMQPGPPRERNELYSGGHKGGYESWSPENSPGRARYTPSEHRHGQGWSHPEQRGYLHGPPPDRLSRNQNTPGFRDHSWHGGGGSRRWQDGDRRR